MRFWWSSDARTWRSVFRAKLHRLHRFLPHLHVKHFDPKAERHREVDIPLFHMMAKPIRDEHDAHQQQERKREHFYRWMPIHEVTDCTGGDTHYDHSKDHGQRS